MDRQINLSNFAEGALQEKFDAEFQKVLKNIQDPNTPWKTPRKITLELKLTTDEQRELSMVDIVAKSTLAVSKTAKAKILIGMDGKGGYLANELRSQVPGQQRIRVDAETGEILEEKVADTKTDYDGIKLVK
jgi:hypothetical protein